jgi:hypothetical protein
MWPSFLSLKVPFDLILLLPLHQSERRCWCCDHLSCFTSCLTCTVGHITTFISLVFIQLEQSFVIQYRDLNLTPNLYINGALNILHQLS